MPLILLSASLCSADQPSVNPPLQSQLQAAKKLRDSGLPDQARKLYESLLPTLRAQPAGRELIETLNNLADIADSAGDYDRAVALSRESALACQKLSDKDCEARARSDAGLALSNAGQYANAGTDLEAALGLALAAKNPETTVLVLNNLGPVYYYEAKYSEALRSYQAALQYLEKSSGADWATFWRQITLTNMATLYQRLGNDQKAISIYREILLQPSSSLTPRDAAHIYANLGVLYRHLGDSEKALENYREAEKWYSREKDVDGEIGVLKNTGIVMALDLGRLDAALKVFDRALALAEKTSNQRETMQARLYRAETLDRLGRLREASTEFQKALGAAEQLGTGEEQWKAKYALGKIALKNGDSAAAEKQFREAIEKIEGLRSKLQFRELKSDFLADKRDAYDALIKLLFDRNDVAETFAYLERSRSRVFQDRFATGRAPATPVELKTVQAQLADKTVLVELWLGPETVAAVWATNQSSGMSQRNLTVDERSRFANSISTISEKLSGDWQREFKSVAAMLPPTVPAFSDQGPPHVLIVPDGPLSLLPFELISTEKGALLLESRDVTYLPSAVLLLRGTFDQRPAIRFPWQQQLLAFGDPLRGPDGPSSPARAAEGSLPATADEIRSIADLSSGRTKIYLAGEDRKERFFAAVPSKADLLHVSTHAVADLDDPERSRLTFSPDSAGGPNNYLYLKELYDVDLRGVGLATLSACDTERGRLVPGEGIQAFSRALLAGGSRSALTTLWRVPDQPTAEFMKRFYFYLLKKHQTKAEALRLAKLDFLQSGSDLSHPRYWAAFVLNGDGSSPVPRFISWPILLLPFPILFLVALVLFRWRGARSKVFAKGQSEVSIARGRPIS